MKHSDSPMSKGPHQSPAAQARPPADTGSHRGGNRQLNAALHRIAIVQARHHPAQ